MVILGTPQTGTIASTQTETEQPSFRINNYPSTIGTNLSSPPSNIENSMSGPTQNAGHYMVMRVNTQKRTGMATATILGDAPGGGGGYGTYNQNTSRTSEVFTIFIPDAVQVSTSQSYDNYTLGGTYPGAAISALKSYADYKKAQGSYGSGTSAPKNPAASIGAAFTMVAATNLAKKIGLPGEIMQSLTGLAFNPFMEVIYLKPEFRTFRFDYVIFPRTQKESADLRTFISRLRYHSSPESKGFFLVPPSTFDIDFMMGGQENTKVEKIYTCVLTNMDVDYTASGIWTTYVDGMPIGIRLSLTFREIVYLTKQDLLKEEERRSRQSPSSSMIDPSSLPSALY